ncbi:MAG: sigma-70 family RNA polymerase sigma factor [Fimbriimonadaceae bacterium]|nr:sigma-70 family RNA polymerase sigma factor [Fimbriimonadaceae bacterium]QYK58542.1 MAG: sigma-70 family RNA polymerase sigma factor [Fimbriimonadaceae bacterium]
MEGQTSEAQSLRRDLESLVAEYALDPQPDVKDLIIVQCSGIVERMARRFSGVEPFEDLAQVGYIGLLNALSKFDPQAGVKFATYATHLVAGEIKHYLRDKSQMIRHPAWIQEMRHRLTKAATALQAELGRAPTEREIAEACKVSEHSVREVLATQELLRVASLDAPIQEDDEDSDLDKLEGGSAQHLSVEDRVVLEQAIRQLRDLEQEVLVLFHFEALSQTEIADRLNISCNYVSHILRQSLSKLRRIFDEHEEAELSLRSPQEDLKKILDPETRAYSETYFCGRLKEELHRIASQGGELAVVIVRFGGLEGLKEFYGDRSVRDFMYDAAEFLRSSVRSLDIVGRYGPNGFGVILTSSAGNAGIARARLQQRFDRWVLGRVVPGGTLTCQLGQAEAPEAGLEASQLLAVADPGQTPQTNQLAA